MRFHKLLARATKNYVFVILVESLMTVVAHFHSMLTMDLTTIKSAHKAHFLILDAIEKDDEPRAQAELEKDILQVNLRYRKLTGPAHRRRGLLSRGGLTQDKESHGSGKLREPLKK